jgi:hypothetical protein
VEVEVEVEEVEVVAVAMVAAAARHLAAGARHLRPEPRHGVDRHRLLHKVERLVSKSDDGLVLRQVEGRGGLRRDHERNAELERDQDLRVHPRRPQHRHDHQSPREHLLE